MKVFENFLQKLELENQERAKQAKNERGMAL
jgi:hypothetical protein